jgi:hypothetical protein
VCCILVSDSVKGRYQLLVSKNGPEVQRVYAGIVATSLFGIDVPLSSQGVRFGSESSGMETDDEIEL